MRPPSEHLDDDRVDGLLSLLPRTGEAPLIFEPLLAGYASGAVGPIARGWVEGLLVRSAASRDRLYRLTGVDHAR